MIQVTDKSRCCGCTACVSACPKGCIVPEADGEGFAYPKVDTKSCVGCGLCDRVCPVANRREERTPLKVYAAINRDEGVRARSSSGGMFTLMAQKVLERGGVVFGVRFDGDWNPVFGYAEDLEGLEPFRRSKYVQAEVGDAYRQAESFLKEGRRVLFTGTPCHIAALKNYLREEYDNLVLMDVLCEGVPSPKVWKRYLEEETVLLSERISRAFPAVPGGFLVEDVSFRNKALGWKIYSFTITLSLCGGG